MCYGQKTIAIPQDFVEINPPIVNSDEWFLLNKNINSFEININDGNLDIRKTWMKNKHELKIPTGTLYGTAGGEWGGLLIYVPFTDPKKQIEIEFANITSIFLYKNQIYITAALNYWNATGVMYKLNIEEEKRFIYEKVFDFEDVPLALTVYNDNLLIATEKNLYIVNDFKKELILENTCWNGLYPNSIAVIDENNVFVGMKGGIARLNLETRTMRFYKNVKISEQECDNDNKAGLANHINRLIRYPIMDYANNIEGTSIYQFDMDSVGKINNIQLVCSSGSLTLDEEAKRVLYNIPRKSLCWNTTQKISIDFKLVDNKIYKEDEIGYNGPQFRGGRSAVLDYIHKNLNYPPEAAEMSVQGKVVCGFIVEKDGTVGMVEILSPLNKYIDAEIVKTIIRMPSWMPGRRAGRPVRVYCLVTVKVELKH